MKASDLLLYAVTECSCDLADVKASLEGGVTFLQLREKDLPYEDFLEKARAIRRFCRVPFVINDNVDIACASGADGVHVGQSDASLAEARRRLGTEKIVGVSACTVEEALAAERGGADYIGVGAMFPTGTKADARYVSTETLRAIRESVAIPIVAIGGIGENNLDRLAGTGIDGIAVVSAIYSSQNVKEAASRLLDKARRLFV